MQTSLSHLSKRFASHVFNREVMEKMLPQEIVSNLMKAATGEEKIRPEYADAVAAAMKEWATLLGATHYCHWFHPMTGAAAEKHDAFIDWDRSGAVIEKLSGKQLLQSEPDASSFPSGGLRSTYEARGYTGWDPTSPAFIWKAGDGVTLCIPSFFYSWSGAALDVKIPLLRSEEKLNDAVMRLLKFTGILANYTFTTLGIEQEYFVIDRALRDARPDLVLLHKTVFGAPPPKGQQLQDHYFTSVKERILTFMHDMEAKAVQLGIPVKTRHNEVAPSQHEVAPLFEKTSRAVDHNILLMEVLRQTAAQHGLSCILHEKPFHELNGSGKHCNWSVATDTGINLLDPTDTPESSLHFLILLTAILHAVHTHSMLLRASIGSASNDFRLGGHEAPPAIISVFLGEALEAVLDNIEKTGAHISSKEKARINLGILTVPDLPQDNTDRNRTSPFAFTGNKFEFRAVGASSNPGLPVAILNTIVAASLHTILDEMKGEVQQIIPVLQKYLKLSRPIRFNGDNYSGVWVEEAKKRGLPNLKKATDAFEAYLTPQTAEVFRGILTKEELASRYDIVLESYIQNTDIHVNLMLELFRTDIYPAALKHQKLLAKSYEEVEDILGETELLEGQKSELEEVVTLISHALREMKRLESTREEAAAKKTNKEKGRAYAHDVVDVMEAFREAVDKLEKRVDNEFWTLPKYRELLFLV